MPEVPNVSNAHDLDGVTDLGVVDLAARGLKPSLDGITDVIDELAFDALPMLPSSLKKSMKELVERLQVSIQNFHYAEMMESPQPEIWKAVQPQLLQVVENMEKMNSSYLRIAPEEISEEAQQEAWQGAVASIQQADRFLRNAYRKLMREDQYRTNDFDDSYMNSLLADAEELMPSEEFEEIDEPVRQMQESVQNFREAEKLEGPQPETWQAFQPQHQQIVENMEKMNASYQQQEPAEVKQEARQRTAASIQQADSFFKDAYQKLMERDRIMQQEMAAMREQLEMMQRIMVNFSPDAMMKCMMAGTDYLREAEGARKSAQKEPTQAHRSFYQAARQSVHSVYQNIKEAPQRACESFKQKAYAEADKGLRRIAGVFDKGIAALTERRNAILNLSPLAKQEAAAKQAEASKQPEEAPKKQENQGSQEKQKEPAKESPVKQEKVNAVSVQQLLNPETSERAVQALADAAMAAGYNAEAVGKAFTDLKIAAIGSQLPEKQPDDQQPNKNLDMPLTAAVLMDRDPVSKAGLFQFLGSQGVTKEAVVQQCTAWKNQADKYLQDKGLVTAKEDSKER